MAELKSKLRSGDVPVVGSRQFKDFDEYLIPPAAFNIMRTEGRLPVSIDPEDVATSNSPSGRFHPSASI